MTGRLVNRDVFQGLDTFVRFKCQHAINQQDRVTMRQQRENLVDVQIDFLCVHSFAS